MACGWLDNGRSRIVSLPPGGLVARCLTPGSVYLPVGVSRRGAAGAA